MVSRPVNVVVPAADLDGRGGGAGFDLRDWWQPTADNFLGLLSKAQIVAALKEAGLAGAASDAEKMKKGDAASHAEQWLSAPLGTGLDAVPGCRKAGRCNAAPDTDEPTSHAA
jgi:ParB family chromosome partitioning protein